MTENRNQQLWKQVCEDDNINAFQTLHGLHYGHLCDFVFSYLKEKELCEEVVSDVFVNIWQKRKDLHDIRNIKSYLYTCSKNHSIDLIRKNSIRIQTDSNLYEIEIPDVDTNILPPLEMKEFREYLQKAIDELPPKCKQIFKMMNNDQLSYNEIAEILSLSRKTVEAQMSIAYKKLTHILKKIYHFIVFVIFCLSF